MAKSYKRRVRMEKAVRLEAALYKDSEIATFLNMTPAGLAQMKMDPEYDILRMEMLSGVVSEAEEEYLKDAEYKYDRIRALIPQALQNLYDLARSQNEHIKLKASAEILDREGSIAKVSRIGLTIDNKDSNATTIDNDIAQNLQNIVKLQTERAKKIEDLSKIAAKNETIQ